MTEDLLNPEILLLLPSIPPNLIYLFSVLKSTLGNQNNILHVDIMQESLSLSTSQ